MSRTNLENLKTYHDNDPNDLYEVIVKFCRFFEKGYHDSQINPLPTSLEKIKNILISTDGASRHLTDFCLSLTPFFLTVPMEISTTYRLPNYVNEGTLIILLSSASNSPELNSVQQEIENKDFSYISLSEQEEGQISFVNLPHTIGFLFGLFSRLNPAVGKKIKLEEITSTIEKTVSLINRDIPENQNPAKTLAQKHSQKAIHVLASGHLQGVAALFSGLIVRLANTFSQSFTLPEANAVLANTFTYPTKVINEYQVLILGSDLYPQTVSKQLEAAEKTLSQKRVNFSLLKPDSTDWFNQIFESVVFFVFLSYYLSIVNKAKN